MAADHRPGFVAQRFRYGKPSELRVVDSDRLKHHALVCNLYGSNVGEQASDRIAQRVVKMVELWDREAVHSMQHRPAHVL
jgi:hypothetical protein